MTVWKWFQVLERQKIDSLCLMDYSFINIALENELRSHKDPVCPLSEDTHMVSSDGYI